MDLHQYYLTLVTNQLTKRLKKKPSVLDRLWFNDPSLVTSVLLMVSFRPYRWIKPEPVALLIACKNCRWVCKRIGNEPPDILLDDVLDKMRRFFNSNNVVAVFYVPSVISGILIISNNPLSQV